MRLRAHCQSCCSSYGFTSDKNGIYNQYFGELETYLAYEEQVIVLKDGEELVYPKDSFPSIVAENIDSSYLRPVMKTRGKNQAFSNYSRNINTAFSSVRSGKLVETVSSNGQDHIYIQLD